MRYLLRNEAGDILSSQAIPDTAEAVTTERDRRIDGGFLFNGMSFQTRPQDRENIAGAAQLAAFAIMAGAQPGDFRWHGGEADFVWIAEDNSFTPMDAHTFIGFARAAAVYKSGLIFAARALKDRIASGEVIEDCTDPAHWP